MHPYQHATSRPDHPAIVIADTGSVLTYRELDERSNRIAHVFRSAGLAPGDCIALMAQNSAEFATVYWAAQRSGLLCAMLSTHLKPDEAAYIINDCGAKLLLTEADLGDTATALAANSATLIPNVVAVYEIHGAPLRGAGSLAEAMAEKKPTPIDDQTAGYYLIYSSGTTGRPKGIVLPYSRGPIDALAHNEALSLQRPLADAVSMAPGPLYHAAPLVEMLTSHRLGSTFVTMRKFDPETVLDAIERWKVERAWFVPTMFVRMLALPDEVRQRFDLSTLQDVSHAAAPCPIEIKRRMIDWLGPIMSEYYSASESIGGTRISSAEWLRKPGSVGRPRPGVTVYICDENGKELPHGHEGLIYFADPGARDFRYLNDPGKTKESQHPIHPERHAVGDIGRVDEDGYLFLTDRKDFMIISGGVNIYPQAVEDALIVHPKVLDAAVIGIPNPDFGEEVLAIIQPKRWSDAGDALGEELIEWCKNRISRVSCPRSVTFTEQIPRLPSGKLAKHELRRLYGAEMPPSAG